MSTASIRRAAAWVASVITLCAYGVGASPVAWADDVVTYEVVSDRIAVANIEWQDVAGRRFAPAVTLPWRADVNVRAPLGPPPDGSQVRADWRQNAYPTKWVTVRIFYRGKLICQNTLDIGNAACYGVTHRIT
ncbi:hypothetical protein [Mycolicibacterium moriokaense]|jgi:hypothetical protein|uniref:Uncharacterized protein n=1 Tax=Mycolicibacterium moriokaense TaxID=39691 RepID=A0AAD1H7I0_9MYCO|nr:hypothetical protein [Mycolicibacterium moriokaense]BBW99629.1 hypothetical protein MMOR_05660 [Mycolicibacterium moriokaense]